MTLTKASFEQFDRPHLTHVERRPELSKGKPWDVRCDCGWNEQHALKRQAFTAGEQHWLLMPVKG